jgi:excisionase family DNA binding protein
VVIAEERELIPPSTVSPRNGERATHEHDRLKEETMTTLLTIQEVRAVLHCSRTYVYELLRNRELRAVKLGRLTRIADVELERFLADKSAHNDDPAPNDGDCAAHPITQPRMACNAPLRITRARSLRLTGADSEQQWLMDMGKHVTPPRRP